MGRHAMDWLNKRAEEGPGQFLTSVILMLTALTLIQLGAALTSTELWPLYVSIRSVSNNFHGPVSLFIP